MSNVDEFVGEKKLEARASSLSLGATARVFDINEESVGITKLSLFLKMARKNRKLSNLSNNIKKDKEYD